MQRVRRDAYQYREQHPSAHLENLDRYLRIAPLIARDPARDHFCIRHPDLQPSNILVSRAPDSASSAYALACLIDWQHTALLTLSLQAAVARCAKIKEVGMAMLEEDEERVQVAAHWPLDALDEEQYM